MDFARSRRNWLSNRRRLEKKWARKMKHHGPTLRDFPYNTNDKRTDVRGIQRIVLTARFDKSWRKKYKQKKPTKRNDKERVDHR